MPIKPGDTAETGLADPLAEAAALTESLAVLAREREAREREWGDARLRLTDAGRVAIEKLQAAIDQPGPEEDLDQALAVVEGDCARRQALLAQSALRLRRDLRDGHEHRLDVLSARLMAERQAASTQQRAAHEQQRRAYLEANRALRQRSADTAAAIARSARRAWIGLDGISPSEPEPANLTSQQAIATALDWIATGLEQIDARAGVTAVRTLGMIGWHLVVALPFALVIAAALTLVPALEPWLIWAIGAGLAAQVLGGIVLALVRSRLAPRYRALACSCAAVPVALRELDRAARGDTGTPFKSQLNRLLSEDAVLSEARQVEEQRSEVVLARVRERELRLKARLDQRVQAERRRLAAAAHAAGAGRIQRLGSELAAAEAALADRLAGCDRRWAIERQRLENAAKSWLESARARLGALAGGRDRAHPPWDAAAWATWKPTIAWGGDAPLGHLVSALPALVEAASAKALALPAGPALALPVGLSFPHQASLLVRAGPATREAALRLITTAALRALTAFPPGRLRLTLIDPVGLGQSFARLLDLADHEEAVLAGAVLSDATRIERGLDDLAAHLQKVIQKHLRGRYNTLDDYNREAGELAEPLRLVLISDFPAGFGERAFDRLSALLRSGARCGVHVWLLHDDRQPLPSCLELAWFRRIGVVLRELHGRLAIDREGLAGWTFAPESDAPAALADRLLATIGKGAAGSSRVEVAFTAVGPAPEQVWSQSTAESLRVPVGKRGADRLQYIELGRGTAQHALVGGRTGSGKSTLFHVLVASAAMWHHPRELELHLIDFKKGVEFRAFANAKLPHARVVAIESDREFALSVLRQLDAELERRGGLFRRAGAQDLAAHRRSVDTPGAPSLPKDPGLPKAPGLPKDSGEHLPRILLLIDEFQEFFTEDDSIARDAALLLDRFVRQGRAFGLHVVLGSQTLGGSYSLAKSSLGQMGVRIVLPCNEADAHLLLHEDNDAARLLTRPGDAIYNDRAGLVDGNSPFQVCWLGEAEEGALLRAAAARAQADGWRPAQPSVVFEGNLPSRLDDDPGLAELLARPWAEADARPEAWVGQSSSLKGAAEVSFPAAAGGNLLIVGQNREAAVATCAAITLAFAARHRPGSLKLLALDGEDRDGLFANLHGRLADSLPHQPVRHEARNLGELLGELAAVLDRRQAGDSERTPIVLTVFALQRLRQLRADEDGGLGGAFGEKTEPPAERFARLLANGPEYGLHTIVWCDSLSSVQRSLGRRTLRDFDARMLFQMSATDSTELIDDDGACRLGLHTALLTALGDGRREKFRPYSLPDPAFLDGLKERYRARFAV